ncbi:MAG: glycosyltransferase [Muribaculaceae bacterium]|nr:glycosyltransferase [Muribaculaceae bacterium]
MNVVIINKSDTTGGAAVVSFRLMEALRAAGVDARMIVEEKLSDSPFVEPAASRFSLKASFIAERLRIFLSNGFDRKNLFKIDIASDGVDLANHPWVRRADAVLLNWVNQGLLSFKGIKQLIRTGKPVIWTMHDMWCFTGICHHSENCCRYESICSDCPWLGKGSGKNDLSARVFRKKLILYPESGIHFVAVSNWLKMLSQNSALFKGIPVSVIPNPFPIPSKPMDFTSREQGNKKIILFGAARLDDPIKDFPTLIAATRYLKESYPDIKDKIELVTFGEIRNSRLLDEIAIPHRHLGRIKGAERLREIYEKGHVIVSTSRYETLPGTLVEGQAYGAVPVSFNRGGQTDIIEHLSTGFIASWEEETDKRGSAIGEGIMWALTQGLETRERMFESVKSRFSYSSIAHSYISLIEDIANKK